jgi:hypothetical protein
MSLHPFQEVQLVLLDEHIPCEWLKTKNTKISHFQSSFTSPV